MKNLFLFAFLCGALLRAQPAAQPEPAEKQIARLQAKIAELEMKISALEERPELKIPYWVRNNFRILNAAMDQFCLDHRVTECRYEDIVGEGKYGDYVRTHIVDGESYAKLRFALDAPEWRVETASGFVVVFKREKFDYAAWSRLVGKEPNKALEPTPTSVTDRAAHAPRQP
jgi:hypothetical protein